MATSNVGRIISLPASGDLSSSLFLAMGVNNSGQAVAATAAAKIVGLLQNGPDAAGKAASVQLDSISKAIAGAAIVQGVELEVGAGGKLITLAAGVSVGFALTAASADGDIFTALLK